MRIRKTALLCLLLSACLWSGARGEEDTVQPPAVTQSEETKSVEGALPQEARELLGELDLTDISMGEKGLESIAEGLKDRLLSTFREALLSAGKLLVIVVLCAAADSVLDSGTSKDAVALCGAAAISAIAAGNVGAFIGLGAETLRKLLDFSHVLLPAMCTTAVSAGAVTSAAAKYAAAALGMDVLLSVGVSFVLPAVGVYLASVIAGAALGQDMLEGVSKFLKWACTGLLTLLTMGFTFYLGICGAITGKADEAALKLTKTAMSTFLPVVGGILSDAAETVVAGAGLVRITVGVLGLLAVLALCAGPFIALGCHYLAYKGAAALSEALADKRMSQLIGGIGEAFGMVLALVGTGGVMLFVSIISSMRMVSGA